MRVQACRDIISPGGMRVVQEGRQGTVVEDCTPSRSQHYGLVPVIWDGRTRAYWVAPTDVSVIGRGDVTKYVTPTPTFEQPVPVPRGPNGHNFHFGRNLGMVRAARGMSQESLAAGMRKAGSPRVSQATLSKWESRSDNPNGSFIQAAAAVLEVPAFMFFLDLEDLENSGAFLREFRVQLTKWRRNEGSG